MSKRESSSDATTTTTTSKKWVPGLYRSDEPGHLLLVEVNPVQVSCVICKDVSCPPRRADAEAFTTKHGYLGQYLAPGLQEYLYQRLGLDDRKVQEVLLSGPEFHWHIVFSTGT